MMETGWVLAYNCTEEQLDENTMIQLLYLLMSFCHLGKSAEELFSEDQNAFLVMFRTTDDEMLTSISIR